MFKENNLVITPNLLPAVVIEVLDGGMRYVVSEMPLLTPLELNGLIASGETTVKAVFNTYAFEELSIPTVEHQMALMNLIEQGATIPTIN